MSVFDVARMLQNFSHLHTSSAAIIAAATVSISQRNPLTDLIPAVHKLSIVLSCIQCLVPSAVKVSWTSSLGSYTNSVCVVSSHR